MRPEGYRPPALTPGGSAYTSACFCLGTGRNPASRIGVVTLLCVCGFFVGCQVLLSLQREEGLEMAVAPPWLRRLEKGKEGPMNPEAGEHCQLGLSRDPQAWARAFLLQVCVSCQGSHVPHGISLLPEAEGRTSILLEGPSPFPRYDPGVGLSQQENLGVQS